MGHLAKYRFFEDIGHLTIHYERGVEKGHYSNPDIDQEKLDDDKTNYAPTHYVKDENGMIVTDENGNPVVQKQTDYIKEKIREIQGSRKLRKDAVKMCCWVYTVPKNLPEHKYEDFFRETYSFLTRRYGEKSGMGEDVVISCYRHVSETTQHCHYAFLPVLERNGVRSFCARELINRRELRECQVELARYLESKNICRATDMMNGRTLKDSNGRAYSVKQLKERRMERNLSYERGRF